MTCTRTGPVGILYLHYLILTTVLGIVSYCLVLTAIDIDEHCESLGDPGEYGSDFEKTYG